MSTQKIWAIVMGAVTVMVAVLVTIPSGSASHIDFAARRAEREAAREARRLEREADRQDQETNQEETCSCTARLGFARPSLFMNGGTLQFTPHLDIDISSRGDFTAPGWVATLAYSGSAAYTSNDVTPPPGVSFSGTREVFRGACGNSFEFNGYALPSVSFTGLVQNLVQGRQDLDGTVRLAAELSGCGFDAEQKQFSFNLKEFGQTRTGSWRTAR